MKTNKNSVVKTAFKEARERFIIVSLPLSFFALITILMFVLAFFAPITLLLTIPFVIAPSFFAVSAINTLAPNENTHEGIGFFIMFRAYFSQMFKSGYRIVIGFLKYLLVFVIVSTILTAILSLAVLYKDADFNAMISQVQTITDENELLNIYTAYITGNEKFKTLSTVIYIASSFCGFYYFMHHFAVNSFKYNYNLTAKMPLPTHDLNVINKIVIKNNRRKFYKDYYKVTWFLGLTLIIGYALGTLIPYFFIKNLEMQEIVVIGFFTSFILLLLFVPYFLNASQLVFVNYRSLYFDTLIDLSKKSLEEMKKAKQITEDKEKEVLNIIESQKNEENNDNKEDNSNEND